CHGVNDAVDIFTLRLRGPFHAEVFVGRDQPLRHGRHAMHFTPVYHLPHTMALPFRQLFYTKSLDELVAETREEGHELKKVLGPWNLVALGIGAIIGAGIFATIGTAAAGDASRPGAGPALMVSFVLTAVVCGFSALCYAE